MGRSATGRPASWALGRTQAFRAAGVAVKAAASVVGLPVAVFCLMAAVGHFTDDPWGRLIPALVVTTGLPLMVVVRLTRDDPPGTGRTAEALALMWLGFSTLFVAVAFPLTAPLLAVEAGRLARSGPRTAAAAAALIARVPLEEAEATAEAGLRGERSSGAPVAADASVGNGTTAALGAARAPSVPSVEDDASVPDADVGPDGTPGAPVETRAALALRELIPEAEGLLLTVSARVAGRDISGSGVFVDGRGTVASCLELAGVEALAVRLPDGSWHRDVTVLPSPTGARDVALLRLEGLGQRSEPSTRPAPVEDCRLLVVGSPVGLDPLVVLAGPTACPEASAAEGEWLLEADGPTTGLACGPVVTSAAELVGLALAPPPEAPRCLRVLPVGRVVVPERSVEGPRFPRASAAGARTW